MSKESWTCPLSGTDEKWLETGYFLHQMIEQYHHPFEFRCNLNAFLTSWLSISDYMRKEGGSGNRDFSKWFNARLDALKGNELINRFKDHRDLIVHTRMLAMQSTAEMGLFRGRTFKLGFGGNVNVFERSEDLLARVKKFATGLFIDEGHCALGEQLGIRRVWIVPELGNEDVVELAIQAFRIAESFVDEAHAQLGISQGKDQPVQLPDADKYSVLLETDLDPTLIKQWGWD